jgi:5-methylcytosine-specific restriction enzyme subunit McrC
LKRQRIELQEYSSRDVTLPEEEFSILSEQFKEYIDLIELGNQRFRIKAKQYVGNIIIPSYSIMIYPKIVKLNFPYMISVAYDLEPFREEDFEYFVQKENTVFGLLVRHLIKRLERLCKRSGITKNYSENEENLSFVKGRILHKENLNYNRVIKNKVYCRFSEFSADNLENRIIKYTLYVLSRSELQNPELQRKTKFLLHYFDSVSLTYILPNNIPKIAYNRLTKQYEPIINLCKLIISRTSLNLRASGELRFSSFLIDMNELFEYFVTASLSSKLRIEHFRVKGGKNKEQGYSDIEYLTEIKPDITIWNRNKERLLVIDTKYKEKITDSDLNQIWIYAIVLGLNKGVLVYPKHIIFNAHERTLNRVKTKALIRTIDLNKESCLDFDQECNRFVSDIEFICSVNE